MFSQMNSSIFTSNSTMRWLSNILCCQWCNILNFSFGHIDIIICWVVPKLCWIHKRFIYCLGDDSELRGITLLFTNVSAFEALAWTTATSVMMMMIMMTTTILILPLCLLFFIVYILKRAHLKWTHDADLSRLPSHIFLYYSGKTTAKTFAGKALRWFVHCIRWCVYQKGMEKDLLVLVAFREPITCYIADLTLFMVDLVRPQNFLNLVSTLNTFIHLLFFTR